jgi:tetratricopeptide (TPR) repeat protein
LAVPGGASALFALLKKRPARAFWWTVQKKTVIQGFAALVLLNLVFGIAALIHWRRTDAVDPRLGGEQLAIAQLKDDHYVFFSPGSHMDLAKARPDLVAAADERAFARGQQLPESFRELDHERQFDAVLLSGDPTTYKPLLQHFSDTRDWVLTWLDNANLIFRRLSATRWKEADLYTTAAEFTGQNKARFLSGAAGRLIAIGQLPMAKRALDAAAADGDRLPEYWTALALYDGEIARWVDAVNALDKALAIDPDNTPALTTKAQILFGARRYEEAMAITDKVVEEHPDDPSMLFLHATISHQAHSYDREIAALKHLIELADAQGESTTGYRIYLGQAYAEDGQAMESLIQFKAAVDAPDISPAQKEFALDCMAKIHTKTDPGAQSASNP